MNNEYLTRRVAMAIICDQDDRLAFQLRDDTPGIQDPGMISGFGGHLELGEAFDEALIREVNEELTIRVRREDLRPLCTLSGSYSRIKSMDFQAFALLDIDVSRAVVTEGTLMVLAFEEACNRMKEMTPLTCFAFQVFAMSLRH